MNNQAILAFGLWLLTMALILGAWISYQAIESYSEAEILPAAGPTVPQSPDGLGSLAGTALQHNGRAAITKNVEIDVRESGNFKENFFNIAAQKGWFAHAPDLHGFSVVIPKEELHALDTLRADPVSWILEHRNPNLVAQGPSDTTNLVNVRLDVDTTGKGGYFRIILGALVCVLGALFTWIIGIHFTWQFIQGSKTNGESKLKAG